MGNFGRNSIRARRNFTRNAQNSRRSHRPLGNNSRTCRSKGCPPPGQSSKSNGGRGRDECIEEFERSSRHHCKFSSCVATKISTNADGNFGREKFDNCIPHSNGFESAQRGKKGLTFSLNICKYMNKYTNK